MTSQENLHVRITPCNEAEVPYDHPITARVGPQTVKRGYGDHCGGFGGISTNSSNASVNKEDCEGVASLARDIESTCQNDPFRTVRLKVGSP